MNMQRLREMREKKGENQEQIAKLLGISRTSNTKYENGLHDPSMESLNILAEHFNVSTDYLLGRTDDPTPPGDDREISDDDIRFALFDGKKVDDETFAAVKRYAQFLMMEKEKNGDS